MNSFPVKMKEAGPDETVARDVKWLPGQQGQEAGADDPPTSGARGMRQPLRRLQSKSQNQIPKRIEQIIRSSACSRNARLNYRALLVYSAAGSCSQNTLLDVLSNTIPAPRITVLPSSVYMTLQIALPRQESGRRGAAPPLGKGKQSRSSRNLQVSNSAREQRPWSKP
jgi:hypothetical protein